MGTGKTYSTRYLADSNNNTGAAGQVLISTATGIDWSDGSDIIGGPYLPLSAGVNFPLTGALYGGDAFFSGYIKFGGYSYIGEDLTETDSLTIASDNTESIFFAHHYSATSTYTTTMEISASGELKMPMAADGNKLTVQSSLTPFNNIIEIGQNGSDGYLDVSAAGGNIVTHLSGYTGYASYFLSNVGIGNTTVGAKLDVSGSHNAISVRVKGDMGTGAYYYGYLFDGTNLKGTTQTNIFHAGDAVIAADTTITDYAGLRIEAPNVSNSNAVVTNNYGIYQASNLQKNYFGGNVGIGTTTPDLGGVAGTRVLTVASSTAERWGILELAGNRTWGGNQVGELKFISTDATNNGTLVSLTAINDPTATGTGGSLNFSTRPDGGSLTQRMQIKSNGDVTIQTSGADDIKSFTINSSNGSSQVAGLIIENDGANGYINFKLGHGNAAPSTKLTIGNAANSGNVGIGVTAPGYKLSVANASTRIISATYIDGANGIMSHAGAPNYGLESFQVRGDFISFWTDYDASHYQGTEKMRIDQSGNVLIGTTIIENPRGLAQALEIESGSPVGIILNDSRDTHPMGIENAGAVMNFTYNTSPLMTILASGNVGIGTTTPGASLAVQANFTANGGYTTSGWAKYIILDAENTGGGGIIWTKQSSTYNRAILNNQGKFEIGRSAANDDSAAWLSDLAIDAGGNVGIGVTIPEAKLHVAGNITAKAGGDVFVNSIVSSGSTTGRAFFKSIGDTGSVLVSTVYGSASTGTIFGVSSTRAASILTTSDTSVHPTSLLIGTFTEIPLYLGTNDSSRITILGSGNVGIGTTLPASKLEVSGRISGGQLGNPKITRQGLGLYVDFNDKACISGESGTEKPIDLGPSNYDLTLHEGANFEYLNGIGTFYFDGYNDYIEVNNFNVADTSNTYEIWHYAASQNGWETWWDSGNERPLLGTNGSNLRAYPNGTNFGTIDIGKWYHVVWAFASDTDLDIYINGDRVAEAVNWGNNQRTGTFTAWLGGDNAAETTDGYIAIARTYTRQLTPEDVLQNYNAEVNMFATVNPSLGIVQAGGNVGIGISSGIDANLRVDANSGTLTQEILKVKGGGSGGNFGFLVEANNGDDLFKVDTFTYDSFFPNGDVGIGVTSSTARLNVSGVGQANNPTVAIDVTNSDSFNHGLEIFDGNLTTGETVLMAIGHSGSTKLTAIFGFIRNENSLDQNLATIGFWGADNKLTVSAGGNVGIGTGTGLPAYKLEVSGNIRSSTLTVYDGMGGSETGIGASGAGGNLRLYAGGTNKATVTNTAQSLILYGNSTTGSNYIQLNDSAGASQGYVGYGSSSNNHFYFVQFKAAPMNFYLNGAVRGSIGTDGTLIMGGDVIAYGSPSDKRLKENIKPIESALDKVSKLQGVTFEWKDKEKEYDQFGKPHKLQEWKNDIGFIAQDVQKVVPELVRENEDGMLSMRHQGIAPILLEAIKELKAEIDLLKSKPCTCNKCNCNI